MEETILGLPCNEQPCNEPSFEIVNVKKEKEDEDNNPIEFLNMYDINIKQEIKLEETLILDDDMTASDTIYECQHCNISFNQLQYLRRHEKTHRDIPNQVLHTCKECGKIFKSPKKLEKHISVHDKVSHTCSLCNKTCKTVSALKVHQRTHSKKKPEPQVHVCEACGKTFSEKYNLVVHMRTHTGSKPYDCETCGKKFTTNSSLKVHRRTHSGERPYECATCHKRFTTSSYLAEHNRYHNDDCPFACTACPKKFKTARLLKNHKTVHNPNVQLIECEKCGKMLKTPYSKKTHDRLYCPKAPKYTNEYFKDVGDKKIIVLKCQHCQREFIGKFRRANFRRHMRLHTKYRPYKCDQCEACYSDWTAWKSHTRTHTNEKPYHCESCDLYFKSPNNLSRHYLNIHRLGKKTTLKPGNRA